MQTIMKVKNVGLACLVATLGFMSAAFADAANTYIGDTSKAVGDWEVDDNWSLGHVPLSGEDVVLDGKRVAASGESIAVKSLTLTGAATLAIGGDATRTATTLATTGDLTVEGGSKLTVYAGTLDDYSIFSTLETDLAPIAAALWSAAKLVTVGGNFTVRDEGSTVYPDADRVTGVPVVFKVAGDFTLGEGASFNAVKRGWGCVSGDTEITYAKISGSNGNNHSWTFAPGSGVNYATGGGYGGKTGGPTTVSGKKYGYAYGYACAPFLSGSNAGRWSCDASNLDSLRGGGAVVIFAAGNATVNGTVDVSSTSGVYSSASGGGIWLASAAFTFGANALLDAHGGYTSNYSGAGSGGGGRIALAEGYSWDDFSAAAGGTVPTGFADAGRIGEFEVATDVSPGAYTGSNQGNFAEAGTCSFVRSASAPVKVIVTVDGPGSVTYGGTPHTESFVIPATANEPLTLTATPGANALHVGWFGELLSDGLSQTASVTVTPTIPTVIRASFSSTTPTARAWTGAASSEWCNGANWSPSGVPGPNDDVTLVGANVSLPFSISLKSLTLSSASALVVGDKDARTATTLATTGDLTVEGASTLTVYAGTLADKSVFATLETDLAPIAAALWNAAKIVTVGGNFTVRDTGSTVYPDADKVTGVPVIFKVAGDFTLGEGASFNAVERGFGWTKGTTDLAGAKINNQTGVRAGWTFAPGSGVGYQAGGGYGGDTGSPQTSNKQKFGYAYWCACAPFLPGSNSGLYDHYTSQSKIDETRGGGAVVVFAAGNATVSGTVDASGTHRDLSGGSGGGIWLAAAAFTFGANALLDAKGGPAASYGGQGCGGGGRIALAEGYDWEDFAAAAGGAVPSGYREAGTIEASLVATDVSAGEYTGTGQSKFAKDGTLSHVEPAAKPALLRVTVSGSGSVTHGGTTYTSTFEVTVPTSQDLTFVATPAAGHQFVSWGGADLPEKYSENATLVFSITGPSEISVSFQPVGTVTRYWVGGADGDWRSPVSWLPAGLPKATESVFITNGLVRTDGDMSVGSLTLSGSAVMSNAAVTVEGDSSTVNLAAHATVVTVTGALRLEGTAKIIPANDPKTGAPVKYAVGSLYVGEAASIDASGQGWQWLAGLEDDPYVVLTQGVYRTRAPGAGGDDAKSLAYNRGAGHGALGGNAKAPYGQPYGLEYAPILPGSPNGLYEFILGNQRRPGGTVWISCQGLLELNGTILSEGCSAQFGAPSGGGIWLCTKGVKAGASARVSANGGYLEGSAYGSVASGGRVALALGLTEAEQTALLEGGDPEALGLAVQDGIDLFAATARGGERAGTTPYYGNSGTVKTVTGGEAYVNVIVGGSPVKALGVDPAYGTLAFEKGSLQTFTAPEYGADPDNASLRYGCAGYVVSNATGEVTRGEGRSVGVTIENGPLTVTWLWGDMQKRVTVRKSAHGSLTLGGVSVEGDVTDWAAGQMTAVGAVPESGYEFVCWEGVLPLGAATENPLQATLAKPLDVTPVFRLAEAATVRTWNGTGDWKDAEQWSPAGNIPGAGDTVVIAGGTCLASNALVAAAVQVTDGALKIGTSGSDVNAELFVAGDVALAGGTLVLGGGPRHVLVGDAWKAVPASQWRGHARLSTGGDLALSNAARLEVMGGPIEGAYTFASGTSFVDIGGALTLADTSVLAPYSEFLTGGSVRMTARTVTVAEGAKIDAYAKGYMWLNDNTPPDAPGIGFSYTIGASHGGVGGGEGGSDPYGYALAPVMPGSPNGNYSSGMHPGGGLIRLHARRMTIEGTLDAGAYLPSTFGGPSGGGIWLTADKYSFGANAVLSVRGGKSNYASRGAGGRIAIGLGFDASEIEALATTGTWSRARDKRILDEAAFRAALGNESMTIDVRNGEDDATAHPEANGTFRFVNGVRKGLQILVR